MKHTGVQVCRGAVPEDRDTVPTGGLVFVVQGLGDIAKQVNNKFECDGTL